MVCLCRAQAGEGDFVWVSEAWRRSALTKPGRRARRHHFVAFARQVGELGCVKVERHHCSDTPRHYSVEWRVANGVNSFKEDLYLSRIWRTYFWKGSSSPLTQISHPRDGRRRSLACTPSEHAWRSPARRGGRARRPSGRIAWSGLRTPARPWCGARPATPCPQSPPHPIAPSTHAELQRRVAALEGTMAQQTTRLEWLTRRTDSLTSPKSSVNLQHPPVATFNLPPAASTQGSDASLQGQSLGAPNVSKRASRPACARTPSTSETEGYRTAEEDADDMDQPEIAPLVVATAPMAPIPMAPIPGSPYNPSPISPASPGAAGWGAESTWSCVPPGGAPAEVRPSLQRPCDTSPPCIPTPALEHSSSHQPRGESPPLLSRRAPRPRTLMMHACPPRCPPTRPTAPAAPVAVCFLRPARAQPCRQHRARSCRRRLRRQHESSASR